MAVDYAALAAQYGGTPAAAAPDYGALAKQFGGTPSGGAPTPAQAPNLPTASGPVASAVKATGDFLGVTPAAQGLEVAARTATGETSLPGNIAGQDAQNVSKIISAMHALPAGDARRQHYAQFLKSFYGMDAPSAPTGADIDPGTALSDKKVIGSFANVGLDVLSGGSLSGEGALGGAASKINAVVAPLSEESTLGRIGNKVIQGAAFGAAQGAAQGATDDKSGTDMAKQAGVNSVLGGVLGGTIQGAGELFKYLTSPEVSESLYNKAIGIDKKTQLADRSPAASMIEQGKVGSKSGLAADAQKTIDATNGQINDILTNQSGTSTASKAIETKPLVDQMRAKLTAQYGDTLGADGVSKLMEDLPIAKLHVNDTLTPAELNSLRQKIDTDFVGNGKWLNVNQDPVKISAFKTAANVLRQTVQSQDERLPGLFDQMSDSITARNALDAELAKPHALTSMLELLGAIGAGGTAISHGVSPLEAVGTGAAAYAAEKAAKSTPVQTAAAVGLDRLGKAAVDNGTAVQAAKAVGRIATRRATAKASGALTPGSTGSQLPAP